MHALNDACLRAMLAAQSVFRGRGILESLRTAEFSKVRFEGDSTADTQDVTNEGPSSSPPAGERNYEEKQIEPLAAIASDEPIASTPNEVVVARTDESAHAMGDRSMKMYQPAPATGHRSVTIHESAQAMGDISITSNHIRVQAVSSALGIPRMGDRSVARTHEKKKLWPS